MFYGQQYGITRDLCTTTYLYARNADRGNTLPSVSRGDDKALALAVKRYSIGVQNQFHIFIAFSFCPDYQYSRKATKWN